MKSLIISTITLFLLLTGYNLKAENQTIAKISAYYYQLSEAVEYAKSEESQGLLYSNEIFFNSYNMPVCGPGNMDKKIIFWHIKPDEPKPEPLILRLQKVIIEEMVGPREYYTEYIFKEGALIFYFNKDPEKGEIRFYYHKGKPIRHMKEQKIYDELSVNQQKMALSIQKDAKKYQRLSLTLHEEFPL